MTEESRNPRNATHLPLTETLYDSLYGKLEAQLNELTEYEDADEACMRAASWVTEIQETAKTGLGMIREDMGAMQRQLALLNQSCNQLQRERDNLKKLVLDLKARICSWCGPGQPNCVSCREIGQKLESA